MADRPGDKSPTRKVELTERELSALRWTVPILRGVEDGEFGTRQGDATSDVLAGIVARAEVGRSGGPKSPTRDARCVEAAAIAILAVDRGRVGYTMIDCTRAEQDSYRHKARVAIDAALRECGSEERLREAATWVLDAFDRGSTLHGAMGALREALSEGGE